MDNNPVPYWFGSVAESRGLFLKMISALNDAGIGLDGVPISNVPSGKTSSVPTLSRVFLLMANRRLPPALIPITSAAPVVLS
jgi:hypothetical protein